MPLQCCLCVCHDGDLSQSELISWFLEQMVTFGECYTVLLGVQIPQNRNFPPNISPNSDAAILLPCDACNVTHAMHASMVLAVQFRLSVCSSVRLSHTCFATISNNALQYFDTTRNGNHSSFLTPTAVGRRCSLRSEICTQSDPPLRKTPTLTDFHT